MKIDDTSRHPSLRASLKSALQTGPSITAGDLTDFKGWERFRSIYQRAAPSLPSQAPNVEDDFTCKHSQPTLRWCSASSCRESESEWWVCQCRDGCRAGRHRRQPPWVLIRTWTGGWYSSKLCTPVLHLTGVVSILQIFTTRQESDHTSSTGGRSKLKMICDTWIKHMPRNALAR